MSIDNGVYIIKTKEGYRVTETQAIDNLWWWNTRNATDVDDDNPNNWEKRETINPTMVECYFKDSEYYNTKEEVMQKAYELYDTAIEDYGLCEYGIQDLGEIE